MRQRLVFTKVVVVKLRLPFREADQTRQLGDSVIGKGRIGINRLSDTFDTQRRAKYFVPLRRPGFVAQYLERAGVLLGMCRYEVDLLAGIEHHEFERVTVVKAATNGRCLEDLRRRKCQLF